ncbi:MAG: hypothetical protein Q9170_000101 [Blastenia crenularia]
MATDKAASSSITNTLPAFLNPVPPTSGPAASELTSSNSHVGCNKLDTIANVATILSPIIAIALFFAALCLNRRRKRKHAQTDSDVHFVGLETYGDQSGNIQNSSKLENAYALDSRDETSCDSTSTTRENPVDLEGDAELDQAEANISRKPVPFPNRAKQFGALLDAKRETTTSASPYTHGLVSTPCPPLSKSTKPTPYICLFPNCSRQFARSFDLARHMKWHFGGLNEKLDCPHAQESLCGRAGDKGFTREDHLNEHLRKVHMMTVPKSREDSKDR